MVKDEHDEIPAPIAVQQTNYVDREAQGPHDSKARKLPCPPWDSKCKVRKLTYLPGKGSYHTDVPQMCPLCDLEILPEREG